MTDAVKSIGHVIRHNGRYVVRCAACGKGVESPENSGGRAVRNAAIESLCEQGWTDEPDGRWRHVKCAAVILENGP